MLFHFRLQLLFPSADLVREQCEDELDGSVVHALLRVLRLLLSGVVERLQCSQPRRIVALEDGEQREDAVARGE